MTDSNDEQFVTAAFSQLDSVQVSPTLERRVAQIPILHPRQGEPAWTWARLWQSWVALGAFSALGVFAGSWTTGPTTHLAARSTAAMEFESDSTSQHELARDETERPQGESLDTTAALSETEDPLDRMFALALSEQWQDLPEDPESFWFEDTAEVTR